VDVIAIAAKAGIRRNKTCNLLRINIRRLRRWEARIKDMGTMEYLKPGPKQVLHGIMPSERDAVISYAGKEETADYSFAVMAIKGAEHGLFYVSSSSIRSILRAGGLGNDRRGVMRRSFTGKPNRPEELIGPNQCWCWDISYIKTDVRRAFWYLYVMLDEWSRKVIAWRISRNLGHEEARLLIDDACISERLLELPENKRPVVVNDHGSQMRAKPVKQMFADLSLEQTFARRKTPNDNPFVESLFSAIKTSPVYPGWFSNADEAAVLKYFEEYFDWYNSEHYHSRIGYVTPVQKHTGQAEKILMTRKNQLTAQRKKRRKYWLSQN
jgi:putative transposase